MSKKEYTPEMWHHLCRQTVDNQLGPKLSQANLQNLKVAKQRNQDLEDFCLRPKGLALGCLFAVLQRSSQFPTRYKLHQLSIGTSRMWHPFHVLTVGGRRSLDGMAPRGHLVWSSDFASCLLMLFVGFDLATSL